MFALMYVGDCQNPSFKGISRECQNILRHNSQLQVKESRTKHTSDLGFKCMYQIFQIALYIITLSHGDTW